MASETPSLDSIFCGAIEITSAEERAAYLTRACGADAELRRQAEKLVAAHFGAGSFLEKPAVEQTATEGIVASGCIDPAALGAGLPTPPHALTEGPGTRIGPYKLLQQIGEGGMGIVYMAEQEQPVRRRVALKIIKPGMDSKQVVARFEAERQALAMMDHQNIARVLDAGTTETGRPYFVMELVHGIPITRYCDENHLTPRERLELFVPICKAIQHAHQKGIIHRDVKPSNVMVTLYDGKPVPKVIDFGVAKATEQLLTERTMFTQYGTMVGTLEYMSPEQAELSGLGVDTRSDIYSLGVLLYELLTGTTPLSRKRLKELAYDELLRMIREEEPPRPSARLSSSDTLQSIAAARKTEPAKLAKLVRGELDWIVMKCLEKDRTRRYETANGLARDVQRYLADEPVEACPPSPWYRLRKTARRHKAGMAMAAGVVIGLAFISAVLGWSVRDRATRREETARAVESALANASQLQEEGRWTDALRAAQRAEALIDLGGGSDELRKRVQDAVTDLEMVERLDRIRLEQTAVKDGHFDHGLGDALYERAFHDYDIEVDTPEPAEAAERVRARSIRAELTAALDEWAYVRSLARKDDASWKRILAVARAADPDPWRNQLRDVLERGRWTKRPWKIWPRRPTWPRCRHTPCA
jgi:serine/threonine protein kinase